jgi:hypothetical protein
MFAAFNLGANPFFAKHPITSVAGDIMRISPVSTHPFCASCCLRVHAVHEAES